MAPAHVQPRHLRAGQDVAEVPFHRAQRSRQVIRPLFAQGMEMKAGNAGQIRPLHHVRRDAQAGAGRAGVIQGRVAGGKPGIDAQAALQLPGKKAGMPHHLLPEAAPLRQAVKIKVVGNLRQLRYFFRSIAGRIGQHMLPEPAPGQPRLPQAGRAAAVQPGGQGIKAGPAGKTFQSQHDTAPGGIRHIPQDKGVAFQGRLADDEGGHKATTT